MAFSACQNSGETEPLYYQTKGLILGADMRLCACCGGLFVNLNTDSTAIDSNTFLIDNNPADLGIDLNTAVFPMKVHLDYITTDCGGIKRITVIRLRKDN